MNEQKKMSRAIVCGTDFSECALEAADIAASIARKSGAKLILVHSESIQGRDPILRETIVRENRRELATAAERLHKLGTEVEPHLCSGSAFDAIVDLAEQSSAWLVVVGAVGRGLARRVLIGSVSERVAETSPAPTLIVRPGSGFLPWLQGGRRLKILVGHDFSTTADTALQWTNELRTLGDVDVTVLYVHLPNEHERSPEELRDGVARLLPSADVTVRFEPCWGNCQGALFEAGVREGADLIVVGTHQRAGLERVRLGSVSRGLLRHATQSVAVVPPSPSTREE